jgi:hypothetical protein
MLTLLFLVSLPAVTARLYSADEVQYFSYLRSLYFDRDVSFENEYRYFYDQSVTQGAGFHETFLERETAAGRRVNYATMGAAVLWLPFYAAADLWTRATGAAEANGMTQPYIAAVAYGSAVYGFLAVLLSARAARVALGHGRNTRHRRNTEETRHSGNTEETRGILGAALAIWLGTPLLFYMYVAPPFAHACSAFAVALFVNVWLHVRDRWTAGGAFALGLAAGLVAMVREQDAFVTLGPAIDFLWTRRQTLSASAVAATAGVAGTLLGFAPQLAAYAALNGYPGPAEHVSRKMYWTSPWGLKVLFSPEHGFFFWTPLAILGLAGLFLLKDRIIGLALVVMAASQAYVAGSVESWTVAGAFGQRRFVCLTVVLVIGLASLWNAVAGSQGTDGEKRDSPLTSRLLPGTVLALVLLPCVWWNIALMAQFATRLMDRQRLEPARNAYHAFVTLPLSAPSLVWRYLTDRESFYDPRRADEKR